MTTFIELKTSSLNSKTEIVEVPICINIDKIASFLPSKFGGCLINVDGVNEPHYAKETYGEIKHLLAKGNI